MIQYRLLMLLNLVLMAWSLKILVVGLLSMGVVVVVAVLFVPLWFWLVVRFCFPLLLRGEGISEFFMRFVSDSDLVRSLWVATSDGFHFSSDGMNSFLVLHDCFSDRVLSADEAGRMYDDDCSHACWCEGGILLFHDSDELLSYVDPSTFNE